VGADWRRFQTWDVLPGIQQGNNELMIDVYDHGGAAGFLPDFTARARRGFSQAIAGPGWAGDAPRTGP
jgi:hypothetical protein